MVSAMSLVKCEYPGCTIFFGRSPRRRYCDKHGKLLLEIAAKKKEAVPVLPAPKPTVAPKPAPPPLPQPQGGGASPTGAPPSSQRVKRGHRKHLEAMKRKFARRSAEKDDANHKEEPQE